MTSKTKAAPILAIAVLAPLLLVPRRAHRITATDRDMSALTVPLAYRFVAVTIMIAEANYCAEKLDLQTPLPIEQHDLKRAYVSRPLVSGFGGAIDTSDYSFSFNSSGRLVKITRVQNDPPGRSIMERNIELAKLKSLIDTNGAYRLATQWLSTISIDIKALEIGFHPRVTQLTFYQDAVGIRSTPEQLARKQLLPVFDVEWSNGKSTAVSVRVFGPARKLLELIQKNDSFSTRPVRVIRDVDKLLEIRDESFLMFSSEQRSKLVTRFAAVNYGEDSSKP